MLFQVSKIFNRYKTAYNYKITGSAFHRILLYPLLTALSIPNEDSGAGIRATLKKAIEQSYIFLSSQTKDFKNVVYGFTLNANVIVGKKFESLFDMF